MSPPRAQLGDGAGPKVGLADYAAENRYLGASLIRPEVLYEHPVPVADLAGRLQGMALTAMLGSLMRGEEVSPFSVQAGLERNGVKREDAVDFVLTITNTVEYQPGPVAVRLRELGEIRRLRDQAQAILVATSNGSLEQAREARSALVLGDNEHSEIEILSWAQVINRTEKTITQLGTIDDRGVRLGGRIVDAWMYMPPGSLTVIGASTGVGKTTYMVDCALDMTRVHEADEVHPARHHTSKVGLISAEDGAPGIGSKGVAVDANVNSAELWKIGAQRMSQAEIARVFSKARERDGRPLFFADVKGGRVEDVVATMRRMRHQHGVECVMIDYLQKIQARPGGAKDPRQRIDDVLAEIHAAAKSLEVALVIASQLSRPDKGSPFRERQLFDLKESGTIENSAQNVILMWRKGDKPGLPVHGKIAKTKNVETGFRFDLVRSPITGQLLERPPGTERADNAADPEEDPWAP